MQTERAIMEVDYFSQVFSPKRFYRRFKTEIWPHCFYFQCSRITWNSISGVLFSSQGAIHMWANSLRAEMADQGIQVS